jgi:NAD-dependent deacetylase sirtuin 4
MTHQQFMSGLKARRRYWARSYAGWHEFAGVNPNPAHEGLARLQQRGWCDLVVTQNVDRLHLKAGSDRVLELHGTTHRCDLLLLSLLLNV